MDGTILGILLGITMTVLVLVIHYGKLDRDFLVEQVKLLAERISILEKRKALLTETVTSQPKPAGVGAVRMRSWNENMPIGEAKG